MPEINESKLKEQIQRGQFGNLYLLYGEEKMLVKRDLLRLTKKTERFRFPGIQL